MYRIYINQIRLTIAENVPNGLINYQLLEEKGFSLPGFYQQFAGQTSAADYLLIHQQPLMLFNKLSRDLEWIEAAGGLVRNSKGEYLFIFRRGKWDLPKGKIDASETPDVAGLREVEEECGIKVDDLGALAAETYHIYLMDGTLVLKKTFWYHMSVNDVPELVPQLAEDISQAVWLNADELAPVKANTYPLIGDLLEEFIEH